jgi:uncharacterized membrane protein SirB2
MISYLYLKFGHHRVSLLSGIWLIKDSHFIWGSGNLLSGIWLIKDSHFIWGSVNLLSGIWLIKDSHFIWGSVNLLSGIWLIKDSHFIWGSVNTWPSPFIWGLANTGFPFHMEFGLFSQDSCFISGSVKTVLINNLIYDLWTCLKY